ncbi:bifunctional glutamate N-acetyltransferase/amino-acid acetyltransferase ArgJ, partial [bacterium]
MAVSAPQILPLGFRLGGFRCGLKNKRKDVGVIVPDDSCVAAMVGTTNHVRAACVDLSREALASGRVGAVVVNSGNANCCTGEQGERDARRTGAIAAERLGLDPGTVAVASTGIIGVPIDMPKLENGVLGALDVLGDDPRPFMEAILTTDLVEKWCALALDGDGSYEVATPKSGRSRRGNANILGMAKGSGMIAPNMATMFGFVLTDLDLSGFDLPTLWKEVCDLTFNAVSVDGDTSTNDMAFVLASGVSGVRPTRSEAKEMLLAVSESLARQIARDGEGATKLIEVRVSGTDDAGRIARSIVDSPLVKTAMFGCDPNWGRVMMAAGKAGIAFDPGQAVLRVGTSDALTVLFDRGRPAVFDPATVSTALKADEVVIDLTLDGGDRAARLFGCDLGYGYVRINAEYHT